MPYRIERATLDHLPWLRMLYVRLLDEAPAPYPLMDEEEIDRFVLAIHHGMTQNPLAMGFVAIIGKRVVGFLAGELASRVIGKPHVVARPHWLYVVPKHRGKGVARQLIAAGIDWLRTVPYLDGTDVKHGVEVVEMCELAGHDEWKRRGFIPFLTHYYVTTDAIAQIGATKLNGHDHEESSHGGRTAL